MAYMPFKKAKNLPFYTFLKVFVQCCYMGCRFFEHTIFTLGYLNEPDTEHFGSDFFASLHVAKLIQFFFNFSLIFCFLSIIFVKFFNKHTGFAKRRANVLNLGFCACGNDSATNPRLRQCFSVMCYLNEI